MTLPLRPLLILAATYVLVLSLQGSWGFFSAPAFVGAVAALILSWTACQVPLRKSYAVRFSSGTTIALDLVFPVFCFCAVTTVVVAQFSTELMYAPGRSVRWPLSWYGFVALAGLILCLRADWRQERASWSYGLLLAALFTLTLASRMDVLARSPSPVIDVYSWLRDSADHLLAGRNPYTHEIDSPYGTKRAYDFGVFEPRDPRPPAYPPVPILLSALPRALRLDVRWANILGEFFAAAAVAGIGRRRGRPWLGLAVATVFLNLPRVPWIIEQAWYEPMLAGLLGVGFWLSEYSGWRSYLGGIFLGLGLTAKQFGLPLLAPVAGSLRTRWRILLLGLAVAGAVMLPFLLAAPSDFVDIVVGKHLKREPQPHSVTIASACYHWLNGWIPPRWLTWTGAAVVILSVSWRRAHQAAEAALAAGTALLAFCLCHTQGFPNYFYLCSYLLLFGFASLLEPHATANEARSERGAKTVADHA